MLRQLGAHGCSKRWASFRIRYDTSTRTIAREPTSYGDCMTDTSTRSSSAYVLGHADAELQRLAEQAALYGDLTEDAFRRAGIVMAIATQEFEAGPPPTPEAFAAMQQYH